MRERLREVDANLLLALHALLEERNLTHAGERMTMSQPAMSGALARLRKHFDDDLLVRSGRGFELSPKAEQLRPVVARAVEAAEALLGHQQREFDAGGSSRRFTVSMSEYAMTVLAEPLTRLLAERAPGCTVALDPLDVRPDQVETQLMRRDLIVSPLGFDFPGRRQPVFTDHLVCVVRRGHPRLVGGALTLDDLAALPHAVAEFAAAGLPRPLELRLAEHGIDERTVLLRVTSLLTLPFAVTGTDMCAFVPSRLARRCLASMDLAVARTPLRPVEITEAAHWHHRRENDPAVGWLRRLLYDIAVEVEDDVVDTAAGPPAGYQP